MASKPSTDQVYAQKRIPKGPIKFNFELDELQKTVVDFIASNKISILQGDPGTAKTTITLFYALTRLRKKDIEKIVITKPIVEVGKSIGFLPGSAEEKVDLYARSYKDIIDDIVGIEESIRLFDKGLVEFTPIQYVRGSTIGKIPSIVVFDECQGADLHEAMTFITRIHDNSQLIIMADPFQADIKNTGIHDLLHIMSDLPDIGIMKLDDRFQRRSKLIQEIYKKYKIHLSTKSRG